MHLKERLLYWKYSQRKCTSTWSTQSAIRGSFTFLLYSDAINSERLIFFMEAIIKTMNGKKVYLILDNLRVHNSKKVSEWLEKNTHQIRLFYLLPYSQEYNPDEYLNNDLKRSLGIQAWSKMRRNWRQTQQRLWPSFQATLITLRHTLITLCLNHTNWADMFLRTFNCQVITNIFQLGISNSCSNRIRNLQESHQHP